MSQPIDENLWERLFREMSYAKVKIRESFDEACRMGPLKLADAVAVADKILRDFYMTHVYEMEARCGMGLLEEFWQLVVYRTMVYRDALSRCPFRDECEVEPGMTLGDVDGLTRQAAESLEGGDLDAAGAILDRLSGLLSLSRRIDALRERHQSDSMDYLIKSYVEEHANITT